MPTITVTTTTMRSAMRPISAGRQDAASARMPPARSGADITGDRFVTGHQVVLRRELVVHPPRPQGHQERQPDEDRARHDEDHTGARGAPFDPDGREDER